jgi:hypothetical protein
VVLLDYQRPALMPDATRQRDQIATHRHLRQTHPPHLPTGSEVGRALAAEKKTRDKAVRVLVRAEQIAPQRIHNDLFVRETVAGLLRQARRDAGGRELRGLAWRMGLAPIG